MNLSKVYRASLLLLPAKATLIGASVPPQVSVSGAPTVPPRTKALAEDLEAARSSTHEPGGCSDRATVSTECIVSRSRIRRSPGSVPSVEGFCVRPSSSLVLPSGRPPSPERAEQLGIGDRHLDNLMLMPAGNLFHIDFGYIFGRDPKPMAPPFRFTREMAEAMGGVNSEDYRMFKTYCCQAYNWLRKSANLILNLLSLMSDAGISELSADPVAVLAKVEERFRLDLTDEMVSARPPGP